MDKNSSTDFDKLHQALTDFAGSPRFALFKDIQVGRLMPEECEGDSALYGMTFEALVRRSTSAVSDRPLCTPAQVESLLQLLVALNEESTPSERGEFSSDSWVQSQGESVAPDDAYINVSQLPGSIQLEQDLLNLRAQIKAHPLYQSVAQRKLGEFWDARWASAPFEEALSIQQFLSIDVATLFKKKSVTGERTVNVCDALRRILEVLDGKSVNQVRDKTIRTPNSERTGRQYNCAGTSHSSCSVADLAVYEVLIRGYQERDLPELAALIEAFISEFTPEECVSIVLGRDVSAKLKHVLSKVVESTLPETTLKLVQKLLEGPAVRINYVANILAHASDQSDAFVACLATVVVRGIGASQARYKGTMYPGFWTLHPSSLQSLLKTQADSSLSLDPFLLGLIEEQGRPRLSRK
jgi:hypothetical protein